MNVVPDEFETLEVHIAALLAVVADQAAKRSSCLLGSGGVAVR